MKTFRLAVFLTAAAAAQQLAPLPAATNIAVNNPGELGLVSPQERSLQITRSSPSASTLLPRPALYESNMDYSSPYEHPTSYLLYNQHVPHYGASVLPRSLPSHSSAVPKHPFVPSYAHLIANNPYQMVGNAVSRNDLPGKQVAFNDLYYQGYIPSELLAQYEPSLPQHKERPAEATNKQDISFTPNPDYRRRLRYPTTQPHSHPATARGRIESFEAYHEPDGNFEQERRLISLPSLHVQTHNRTDEEYPHKSHNGRFRYSSPKRRTFTEATSDFSYRPSITSTMKPVVIEEPRRYQTSAETHDSDYEHWRNSLKHGFGRKIVPKDKSWHVDTRNSLSPKPAPASPLYSLSFLTPEDIVTRAPSSRGNNLLMKDFLKSQYFSNSKPTEDFVPQPNLAKHSPPYYLPYSPLTDHFRPMHDLYLDQAKSRDPSFEYYDLQNHHSHNQYPANGHAYSINNEPLTDVYDIYSPTYTERIIPPYKPIPIAYNVETVYQNQPKQAWNSFFTHQQTSSIQEQLDSFYRGETFNQHDNNPVIHVNDPNFHEDIESHVPFPEYAIRGTTNPSTTERPVLQAANPNFLAESDFYSTTPFPHEVTTKEHNAWSITPPPSFFPDRSQHTTAPSGPTPTTTQSYDAQDVSGHRKVIESSPDFQEQVFRTQKQANEPKLRPYVPDQKQGRQRHHEKNKTQKFVVGIPPLPPNLPMVYHPQFLKNNFKPSYHDTPLVKDQWKPSTQFNGYAKTNFHAHCNEESIGSVTEHVPTDDSTNKIHETITKKPSGVYFSPYASLAPPVTPHTLRLGKTNFHPHKISFNKNQDDYARPPTAVEPMPIESYSKYAPMIPRDLSHEALPVQNNEYEHSYDTRAFIPPYHRPVSDIYTYSRRVVPPPLPYLPRTRTRRRPLWFRVAMKAAHDNQRSYSDAQARVPQPAPDSYSPLRRNGEHATQLNFNKYTTENESIINDEPRTANAGVDESRGNVHENPAQESNEIEIFDSDFTDDPQLDSTSQRSAAEEKIYHLRQHQKILQNTKLRPPLEEMNSRNGSEGDSKVADQSRKRRRVFSETIKRRKARNRRRRKENEDTEASEDANHINRKERQEMTGRTSRRNAGGRRKTFSTQQPKVMEANATVASTTVATATVATTTAATATATAATATAATTLSDGISLKHIYEPFLQQLKEWDAKHG